MDKRKKEEKILEKAVNYYFNGLDVKEALLKAIAEIHEENIIKE